MSITRLTLRNSFYLYAKICLCLFLIHDFKLMKYVCTLYILIKYYFAFILISSSAFEDVLSCTTCIDPGTFGRRADPWGDYVRVYIPELKEYPVEYLYEPWTAPKDVQEKAGCIIGHAHHMFSRFLNLRIYKKTKILKISFVLFFYKVEVFY